MRVLLVLVIIVVAAGACVAGEFQNVIGGAELDRGVFVSPTSDGGYIVVGVTRSSGEGDDDIYLVKYDAAGKPVWTTTHGGPAADNGWSVHEIDGGYAVAGFTKSFGAGGFDFWLLITDRDGVQKWSKTYGGEADDRCWGLRLTPDGGYVLVGETLSSGAGAEDILLVKTDAAGKEEWSKTYGGEKGDRGFSVAVAGDGGFLLAGQTFSEGAGDRDAYVIKTDAKGTKQWSKTFGGAESDVAHCVISTADGNFLVTGYTTSLATSGDDPYLIKIDSHGEPLWTRVLPVDGIAHAITGAQGIDGGFFLVGFTINPETNASAALLIHTDGEGQLDSSARFLETSAGQSFAYTVRATSDGGCVFTGHTTVGSAGNLDLFIVKR